MKKLKKLATTFLPSIPFLGINVINSLLAIEIFKIGGAFMYIMLPISLINSISLTVIFIKNLISDIKNF